MTGGSSGTDYEKQIAELKAQEESDTIIQDTEVEIDTGARYNLSDQQG